MATRKKKTTAKGPDDPSNDLPDARDGLTRKERVVLLVLSRLQAEQQQERGGSDRNVPVSMLYGFVVEHIDMSVTELQQILIRLGARR